MLYVLGLNKNILSVFALDSKGMRFGFFNGQVLMWPKGNTIHDAPMIGEEERGLYKLKGQPEQWYERLAHEHYKELPMTSIGVSRLVEIQENNEGFFKGCS